jgi:hypothetical protein
MRRGIVFASWLAIVCVSCVGCRSRNSASNEKLSELSGHQSEPIQLDVIGDCYANPIIWGSDPNAPGKPACKIQVESLKKGGWCDYDSDPDDDHPAHEPSAPEDKDPVVFSVFKGEHIVFWSNHHEGLKFRVRRFVRLGKSSGRLACSKYPFRHRFEEEANFDAGPVSTQEPLQLGHDSKPTDGCDYKLEVQIEDASGVNDKYHPPDPHSGKRHLCYDPHIRLSK